MSLVAFINSFVKLADDNQIISILEGFVQSPNQEIANSAKLVRDFIFWKQGRFMEKPKAPGVKDINNLVQVVADPDKITRICKLVDVDLPREALDYFNTTRVEKQYVEYLHALGVKNPQYKNSTDLIGNFISWKADLIKEKPRSPGVVDINNLFYMIEDVNKIKYIAKLVDIEVTPDMINYFQTLKNKR